MTRFYGCATSPCLPSTPLFILFFLFTTMTDCEMLDVSHSTTSTSSNAPSRSPPPDQQSLLSLLGLSVQKMTAALAKILASTDLDMRARFMMGLRWEVVSVHHYMISISVLKGCIQSQVCIAIRTAVALDIPMSIPPLVKMAVVMLADLHC